jgi:HSP20 family protein
MASRDTEEWLWITGRDLQRLADELTNLRPSLAGSPYWEPKVDLIEENHRFLLKAELPGVRPEDIHVHYVPEKHALVLRGHRQDDLAGGDSVGVHQIEIFYGEFHREVRLPVGAIDGAGVRAQYRNGFLLVMIPKMLVAPATRHITIKRS